MGSEISPEGPWVNSSLHPSFLVTLTSGLSELRKLLCPRTGEAGVGGSSTLGEMPQALERGHLSAAPPSWLQDALPDAVSG